MKRQRRKGAGEPTPMMAQYLGIKAEHEGALLLFRMGDFYETFYEDAKVLAEVLGITLTSREKNGGDPIPLAGVPHHSLEHYLARLLDAGHTVAICEQVEDPAQARGLVRREVVEILSPGTVTNPALLKGDDNAFLLALAPAGDGPWGYALLDGSTGEFRCGELPQEEALSLPRRYRVAELLLPGPQLDAQPAWLAQLPTLPTTGISPLLLERDYAAEGLRDHFGLQGLEGLGLSGMDAATRAAGAALRYLADRQRSRPGQVRELQVERSGEALHLDRETVAHLELFEGLRAGDRETSLFHHLDETRTPMGRRRLASWLRAPLCDVDRIRRRHDAVAWLVGDIARRDRLREGLRGLGDLERIAGRLATRRAMPHELGQLRDGLARVPSLAEAVAGAPAGALEALAGSAPVAGELHAPLAAALVEEPPNHLRNGGAIRDGHDGELDGLRALARGGKEWVANYQQQERERTGIASLKVGYNKVFGYYLEVTNPHLSKVPDDYQEKQTLTNARRFITPALKEREQEILRAQEQQLSREQVVFAELLEARQVQLPALHHLLSALADADALASLAYAAATRSYVRPEVDDSDALVVEGGRHPVVERIAREPFVPNDLELDGSRRQLLLLTGPNMGGKSTYLRQAALTVVLAQAGSFVPADRARVGVVDRLYTRVGASDNLARGQSTFLVEMAETANILRNATARSLVVLDEVGRGTSTDDGLALAQAITEYLHDGPRRPKTLFATHFHELTALADRLPRAANVQMQVKEWEGQILFLHRVVPGASDRSYGIHVAELAGIPDEVVARASELLGQERPAPRRPGSGSPPTRPRPQLDLFGAGESAVLERLRAVEVDQLRPVEALALLDELARRLRDG